MAYASIGSATGTLLDSAAKHTMACKVDDDLFVSWNKDTQNARRNLKQHKYKYAMQKHELVLNVSQRLRGCSATKAKAYPSVITAVADMDLRIKKRLTDLYACVKAVDFIEMCDTDEQYEWEEGNDARNTTLEQMWSTMPFFTVQGYSLGTAWATAECGDTVGTVLVGGMITVRNGAFACRAGETVQFYFEWEEGKFRTASTVHGVAGSRILNNDVMPAVKAVTEARKRRREMEAGEEFATGNKCIAFPKPYKLSEGNDCYGDRIRVFAKCISGGRPFDMIDLMLMTQSL